MRKITFKGIDKQYTEAALVYVDKEQQPNNWLNLQLYYTFSRHGKKDIGEAPRVLDSSLVEFSRLQLERFLQNKGYVKAKVESDIKIKNQRAELIFNAHTGPMFHIRKFQDSIADPKVRDIYRANRKEFSHIQPGNPFDLDSLAYDRDQIFQLMKRKGYFEFYRQYISFEYDTVFNSSVADVKMIIANPLGANSHPQYTINNTLIVIYKSNGKVSSLKTDTLQVDSQLRFVDYSHKFKPIAVKNYIFQKKGDIYDVDKQSLTTSRLSELNVFRNVPNPSYTKTADSTKRLDSKIDIIPLKHMNDGINGEFIIDGGNGNNGFNLGNTFTDRNLFKGAEILQVKANWSVLFRSGGSIQNQNVTLGASLIYPRIISPFNLPMPGKYGVPHTTFSSTYQLFFQDSLVSRKSFINSITYDWFETSQKQHSLTPINLEYSYGAIDSAARALLISEGRYSYVYLIGRRVFTAGSQYTYQLNANKLFTVSDFTYFRGTIDVGGNTLYLLSNLLKTSRDTSGQRTILGQPFAQYAKVETDLRVYKKLGAESSIVFRINPGMGVPYGNSNQSNGDPPQLIFEKNFYVGGTNDIRAWLPRTLGAGQFNRASYGTTTAAQKTRDEVQYLDQFGEIKIVGNIEYRFPVVENFFGTKLNGAFFTDFGNVWRLSSADTLKGLTGPYAHNPVAFTFGNAWQSTAIGIGTGLRIDFSFFVFRLDAAFKFKDPQFLGNDQWTLVNHFNELFNNDGAFKTAYKAANGSSYNFMQLNFGIGLPF